MASPISSPLVLLDLHNEYQRFEDIFDSQLFSRFTDRTQCQEHLLSRPANIRPLHFFLPNSEHTIIGPNILFSNTTYYIYCSDQMSINEMNRLYTFPMFVKVFDVQSLSMNLRGAATLYWIEHANRTMHQPDERDIALHAGAELAETLCEELREHINVQIGVQPDD